MSLTPGDIPPARTHAIVVRASNDLSRTSADQVKLNIAQELRHNLVIIDDEEELHSIVLALYEKAKSIAFPNGDSKETK